MRISLTYLRDPRTIDRVDLLCTNESLWYALDRRFDASQLRICGFCHRRRCFDSNPRPQRCWKSYRATQHRPR